MSSRLSDLPQITWLLGVKPGIQTSLTAKPVRFALPLPSGAP